jgi:predicted GNAT family acetyltransferase
MATAYPGGLRKRGGLLDNEDTIQATPRNPFFGGVADLLGQAYKLPEMPRLGVPGMDFMAANRNRLMDLLGVGDVQKTAEALSYGNRLGTGRGMTYRPLPETVGAAMAVAPFAGKAVRATEGLPVGASIKPIGNKNISVKLNEPSNFLSAKSEFGEVGGTIRPPNQFSDKPYLQINYAEVEKASRGKGKGKELYQSLIDDAQARGLRVFSDSAVEKQAVNVYKSLEKSGYKLKDMTTGRLEDGAVYGAGATNPAFEISSAQSIQFPQQAALDLAQQRAALPVEQGGLGLLESNTAMDRAKAMGFDTPVYHATEADFMSIRPSVKGKIGPGVYTSFDPSYAERYAGGPGAQTMPLLTRGEIAPMDVRSDISDAVQAQLREENPIFDMAKYKTQLNQATANRGYSGYDVDKERLMFSPDDIRSRFAAFDPFRRTAATAAAMGVAAPDLLAAELPEEMKRRQLRGLLAP